MNDDLPQGWTTAPLREVVDARKGKKPKVLHEIAAPDRVPYLLIDQMEGKPARYFTDDPKVTVASKDDVLVVWDGSIGKCAAGLEGAVGSTIVALKPMRVESGFLEAFIKHSRRTLLETSRGTGLQHINQQVFWELAFPLAPVAEQRRIVAKLEKLLSTVDTCQQRLAKIHVLLKRLRQSVLAAAYSGRLTADWREENPNEELSEATRTTLLDSGDEATGELRDTPDSWVWTSLNRVCLKITDGEHLSPPVTERGVPLLSAKDVRDNHLDFSDTKFVTEEFAKKSRARCNPEQGDILVVSRGATVGRTCRVQVADVFCLMGSVLLFKPDGRYVLPQMIEFCFKSPSGLAALIATSSSTAQQAIYIKDMRSFALPVPPLTEQQEIVRRVEALFALANQIEAHYAKAKAHVENLTQSILAKAFRGKLVPQDTNDEPASALLERIKKNKSKSDHAGKRLALRPS